MIAGSTSQQTIRRCYLFGPMYGDDSSSRWDLQREKRSGAKNISKVLCPSSRTREHARPSGVCGRGEWLYSDCLFLRNVIPDARGDAMAFKLVQNFEFKKAVYDYDRKTDVLDVSFGPPVPAV